MSHAPDFSAAHESDCSELSKLVFPLPSGRRGAVLQSVVSFRPELTVERSFDVGRFRAAFADYGKPHLVKQRRSVNFAPSSTRRYRSARSWSSRS